MCMGTFNLEHGKVILGSFGALLYTKMGYNSKTAHRRAKRTKLIFVPISTFDIDQRKVILGRSVHYPHIWEVSRGAKRDGNLGLGDACTLA